MAEQRSASGPGLVDLLFEEAGVGLCLVAPDGTVVRANAEWLRSTGYTAAQAIGEDIIELFPETRDMALAMHARARDGHRVDVPRHAQCVNGRETWWDGNLAPVPMEGGTGLLITARQIQEPPPRERIARERGTAVPNELYRTVFEHSVNGALITSSNGNVLRANEAACRAFRRTESEIQRLGHVRQLMDGDAPDAFLRERDRTGSCKAELIFRRADGTRFPAETSSALIVTSAGERYAFFIFRDLTERKRAAEALRNTERRKDEFLGMLSHELRNPLAPIRNSIYILRHAQPGGDQARRAQDVIERQTDHLTRLVDDLLDIARIARGRIELRRAHLDLGDAARRTADDFRLLMQERGVSFRTVFPDVKVWVHADATRLAQLLGNLLHNAAKFTRPGDEVTLSVAVSQAETEIRVRDTGAGIDPALLPLVFEAFVQGDHTLARTEGGLGLGLALVRAIAELHGGSVAASSAGPGHGSEFVVRLPAARTGEAAQDGALDARPRASRCVLVVDDNRDAASSLAQIVKMFGCSAEVAFDGPSAVAVARATRPDVVLCDVGLPGMSGYDVARTLRADGMRDVLLIAVSGYALPEDLQAAVDAGFDRHLTKPADPDDIERLLSR